MSVFAKFAKDVIKTVADFEEAAARIAADLGVNADDLKQRAADLSPVSLMGPIEALRHLADKEDEE